MFFTPTSHLDNISFFHFCLFLFSSVSLTLHSQLSPLSDSQKKKKTLNSHLSLILKKKKLSPELLSFTTIKHFFLISIWIIILYFFLITFQNSLPAQNPHQKNTEVLMEGNVAELTN